MGHTYLTVDFGPGYARVEHLGPHPDVVDKSSLDDFRYFGVLVQG